MKVIGLCGGSGSGKGCVAKMLADRGFLHIDTDAVYHALTSRPSECTEELRREFGESVIAEDGSLDRRALAAVVFGDGGEQRRAALNGITHRYVLSEVRRIIRENEGRFAAVIVDAPLLYESGFDSECDSVIAVIAPTEIRIDRIIKRDGVSREQAQRRIAAQISDTELGHRADYVINNSEDLASLRAAVDELAKRLV